MPHTSNSRAFVAACEVTSEPLLKAYFGLIAIELQLKAIINLKDHDIPKGLQVFGTTQAIGNKRYLHSTISSLRQQFINDLQAINVTGKDGKRRSPPINSYPFIRYTMLSGDNWGFYETPTQKLTQLAKTVSQIRHFLRINFDIKL